MGTAALVGQPDLQDLAIRLAQQQQPPAPGIAAPVQMPDQKPDLSIVPQRDAAIKAPRGTVEGDQAERARMLQTGAGEDQIQGKLENSHFGQVHPVAAKILGGLGQGIAKLGDVGLSAIAPALAINLPGTEYHHMAELHGLNKQIGAEEGEQENEARTGLQNEQTAELPGKTQSEEGLQAATAGNLESETKDRDQAAAMGPTLAAGYAHAVNQAIKEGRDPAQDPIVQHLSDAITSLQKQSVTPPGTKTVQLEVGGKPHQVLVDERTGETVRDLGESGEKPPTVNVNEGHKEELAQKQQVYKTYQPVMDSAERFNVMGKNYEDAIKNHDQQAMLSLLYNHMGMTMGLQKGARMTKDLIHEAQQSQPWLKGIEAKFDNQGYLTGVTLSPQQMQEMVNNAQGRYQEDVVKARNEAKYLGAQDDGPNRTPNGSVINFYLGRANGDVNKAKQMAAQDGWSVQ